MVDHFVGMEHTPVRLEWEEHPFTNGWVTYRNAAIPSLKARRGGLRDIITRFEGSLGSSEDPVGTSSFDVDQCEERRYRSMRSLTQMVKNDLYSYENIPYREFWDTFLQPLSAVMDRLDTLFGERQVAAEEKVVEPYEEEAGEPQDLGGPEAQDVPLSPASSNVTQVPDVEQGFQLDPDMTAYGYDPTEEELEVTSLKTDRAVLH